MTMTNWWLPFVAVAVTAGTMPIVRRWSLKHGFVAKPDEKRKIHKKIIPSAGGVAIFLGFLIATLLTGQLDSPITGFLIGCFVVMMMGTLDEKFHLSPWLRLFFQIVAAGIVVASGTQVRHIGNFGMGNDGLYFLGPLTVPFTMLWIVGITNAINLIDGLDGLAGGVTVIASMTLGIVASITGSPYSALLCFILAGASLAYLPYNFTNRPKLKTFMGDGGSNFMGFSLAVLSILGDVKVAAAFSFLVPVIILAIPIFDTLFAIVRRLACGQNPFQADRKHLHHRILDRGLSQTQATILIYIACLVLGGVAIFSTKVDPGELPILFLVVAVVFLLILWGLGFITLAKDKKE